MAERKGLWTLAGILFLAILLGVGLAGNGQSETIVVAKDGSGDHTNLAQGIAAASEGDTIRVYAGTYQGKVVIDKQLKLIGNGSSATTIEFFDSVKVVYITADRVTFKGFMVVGEEGVESHGIVMASNHSLLADNLVLDSKYGIKVDGGEHNTIRNNTMRDNEENGLITFYTHFSSYLENHVRNSHFGIKIRGSYEDTFLNNTSTGNTGHGMYFQFSKFSTVAGGVFSDNQGDGLVSYANDDILFERNNCSRNKVGLVVGNSNTGHIVKYNQVYQNEKGIEILSDDTKALFNHIVANTELGLESHLELDVSYNWWGHASGPYNQFTNPSGQGDAVDNDPFFEPWLNDTTGNAPRVGILSYFPSSIEEGSRLFLEGYADDPDMEGEVVEYHWFSDVDGILGNTSSIAYELSAGEHNLTYRAKDDQGLWSLPAELKYVVEHRAKPVLEVVEAVGEVGEPFYFTGRNSKGRLGEYRFEFGNGEETPWQTAHSPIHEYTTSGVYTVSLWVRNVDGFVCDAPATVEVQIFNRPPLANIVSISNQPALEGHVVTLQGRGEDIHGSIVGYEWSSDLVGHLAQEDGQVQVSLPAGIHNLSFRVQDNDGAWSPWVNRMLLVQPRLVPILRINKPVGNVSESILFDAGSSAGYIQAYKFIFGDGSTSGWTSETTVYHNYQRGGDYRPELWVRNEGLVIQDEPAYADLTILPYPEDSDDKSDTGDFPVGVLNFCFFLVLLVFLVFIFQRYQSWRSEDEYY